jgi:hypothetical protein
MFPLDEDAPNGRSGHIEIHRHGDYLEVRQGRQITGSILLEKDQSFDPEAKFTIEPMVIVIIQNGYRWPEDK